MHIYCSGVSINECELYARNKVLFLFSVNWKCVRLNGAPKHKNNLNSLFGESVFITLNGCSCNNNEQMYSFFSGELLFRFFSANDFIRPFFFWFFWVELFFSVLGVTIFKNSINGRFCSFFSLLVNAVEGNTSTSIYGRGCVVLITIVARQYKVHRPVE